MARRNAVRGEDQPRAGRQVGGQPGARGRTCAALAATNPGCANQLSTKVTSTSALACARSSARGGRHVLAVLLAARVGMLRGDDEPDRTPHAGLVHVAQRVGQQRMPVAHADVDRQRVPRAGQTTARTIGLAPGDRRDRRHAAEELVVTRHLASTRSGATRRPRSTLARNGRMSSRPRGRRRTRPGPHRRLGCARGKTRHSMINPVTSWMATAFPDVHPGVRIWLIDLDAPDADRRRRAVVERRNRARSAVRLRPPPAAVRRRPRRPAPHPRRRGRTRAGNAGLRLQPRRQTVAASGVAPCVTSTSRTRTSGRSWP